MKLIWANFLKTIKDGLLEQQNIPKCFVAIFIS